MAEKKYTIIQGDSAQELKHIKDNTIDTIVTSPPYNLAGFRANRGAKTLRHSTVWKHSLINYGNFKDDLPETQYQQQQIDIINECHRILRPTGSLFYQHKIRRWGAHSSHPMEWISRTRAKFYQEIMWNRGSTMAKDPHYLLPYTESIYWLTKSRPTVFRKQLPAEFRMTIWNIATERNNDHPAPFPVMLPRLCILLTTPPRGHVLDPFAGSGTTGMAAMELGHTFTGIEQDVNYVEIANKRIKGWLNPAQDTDKEHTAKEHTAI